MQIDCGDPGDCAASAWNAGMLWNGGDTVSWNDHARRAKWWAQGEQPGTTGEWDTGRTSASARRGDT